MENIYLNNRVLIFKYVCLFNKNSNTPILVNYPYYPLSLLQTKFEYIALRVNLYQFIKLFLFGTWCDSTCSVVFLVQDSTLFYSAQNYFLWFSSF